MRVGFVVPGGTEHPSGGDRYDRRLATALRDAGVTVDEIELPGRGGARGLLHNLDPRLRRRLDGRHDVLLEDELCHPSLLRARPGGTPTVALVHHLRSSEPDRSRLASVLERRYLATVDAAVCVSRAVADAVRTLRPVPTTVAGPGRRPDPPPVTPAGIRERSTASPLRVVTLGALVPRKGLLTLIEGLAAVNGGWRLDVVGDTSTAPAYVDRVRGLVDATGLGDAVTFHGWLPEDAVASRLRRAHVLAGPSTYEGFGMAYLEAMGYGVVPIATAAGGPREFITHGETGFLVPPGDPDAVTAAVGEVLDDRSRLAAMGIAARERYLAHHRWRETGSRVRAAIRGVLDDPPPAEPSRAVVP